MATSGGEWRRMDDESVRKIIRHRVPEPSIVDLQELPGMLGYSRNMKRGGGGMCVRWRRTR